MSLISDDLRSKSVLVLEDAPMIAEGISLQLKELGFQEIRTALSLREAQAHLANATPDIALLDLHLGKGENSLSFAETLLDRQVAVMFTTGYASLDDLSQKFRHLTVLTKPFGTDDLADAILKSLP